MTEHRHPPEVLESGLDGWRAVGSAGWTLPSASWASSTSRPTRSPTAASGSTATPRCAHGRELVAEGAAILDVGGESTRPGAAPGRRGRGAAPRRAGHRGAGATAGAQLSVDTAKARASPAAALAAGATLRQRRHRLPRRPGDGRRSSPTAGCDCCLMHMLGEPRTMQDDPRYDDVVDDVKAFLEARMAVRGAPRASPRSASRSTRASASARPLAHNLELLRRLDEIVALGRPVVVGTSRKSFLGRDHRPRRPARARVRDGRHQRPGASSAARASSASTTSPRRAMRSRWPLLRCARDGDR